VSDTFSPPPILPAFYLPPDSDDCVNGDIARTWFDSFSSFDAANYNVLNGPADASGEALTGAPGQDTIVSLKSALSAEAASVAMQVCCIPGAGAGTAPGEGGLSLSLSNGPSLPIPRLECYSSIPAGAESVYTTISFGSAVENLAGIPDIWWLRLIQLQTMAIGALYLDDPTEEPTPLSTVPTLLVATPCSFPTSPGEPTIEFNCQNVAGGRYPQSVADFYVWDMDTVTFT
jgi:hypothetical protein